MNRVGIQVTKHYGMLKVAGVTPYPLFLGEDEASELYLKMAEALGQFIHEPGGCGCGSGCPCVQRGER